MSFSSIKILTVTAITCLAITPLIAQAENWSDKLVISGFASANYHKTDEPLPFNGEAGEGHDDQGSFAGTRFGINFNATINDKFKFAGQLFATKEEDNYATHVDWGFGTLKLTDSLDLRAGKLKFPVGLVNEYIDVGYAYPWMHAPTSFYSEAGANLNGPQVTREAYSGASLLWKVDLGDWETEFDLFVGEINLEGTDVRKLQGLVVNLNLDEEIFIELATYEGNMQNVVLDDAVSAASGGSMWQNMLFNMQGNMQGADHSVDSLGIKYDSNNILFMYELANVTMGQLTAMEATAWYTTLGYRMGEFMPHITFENYEQGDGSGAFDDDQDIVTLGLRWDYVSNVAIKFELTQIKLNQGNGLFGYEDNPEDNTINMFGIGIDTVF